jgi:hypothetical protein
MDAADSPGDDASPQRDDAPPTADDHLRWSEIVEAAEEAEWADGGEETEAEVRAHLLIRLGRISLASVILLAGVIMLALPGPGWLVIAVGLALLSRDVAWAERWLVAVRKRVPGARPDGTLPTGVWATIVVMALAGTAVGLWFAFR